MDDTLIRAHGLGKRYRVFRTERARLLHTLLPGYTADAEEVWALRGVDLEVRRGDSVAVIGRNGSGKSSLLQILTGTLAPTEGRIEVRGRVSALLELGSGFNPDYTGRENVILNGLLLGLRKSEMLRRFDQIADFAEVGGAMDRPVRTYSSGMLMRLAFAVQVLTDPEILVVDEALSVGDFFFQQKCFAYIRGLRERGVTLVFVSHDMGTVRDTCSRAVYLREGRVAYEGSSSDAIRHYLAEAVTSLAGGGRGGGHTQVAPAEEVESIVRDAVWRAPAPEGDGRVVAVGLYDAHGQATTTFRLGDTLHMKVAYRPARHVPTHVTAVLRNKYDQVVTSIGSSHLRLAAPRPDELSSVAIFNLRLKLSLEAGNYSVMVGLGHPISANHGENLDLTPPFGPISVQWDYEHEVAPFLGMVGLEAQASFARTVSSGEPAMQAP